MCAFYSHSPFTSSSSSINPSFSSTATTPANLFAGSQFTSSSSLSSSSNAFSSSSNTAFGAGFAPFASSPSLFSRGFDPSSPSNPVSFSPFPSTSSNAFSFSAPTSSSSSAPFSSGFSLSSSSSNPSFGIPSSAPFSSGFSFSSSSSNPSFGIPSSPAPFFSSSATSFSTPPLFGPSLFSSSSPAKKTTQRTAKNPEGNPVPVDETKNPEEHLVPEDNTKNPEENPLSEDETQNPEGNPVSEESRDKLQEKEYLENADEGPQAEENVIKTEIIGEDKKRTSASSIKDENMSEPKTYSSPSSHNSISEQETRVLKGIPQNPHFHPLQIYSKRVQKNLIRGWDQTCVEITEKIENLLVEEFWESIDELQQTLSELESMGYNVMRLKKRLDALKEVMVTKKESWVDIVVLQKKVEDRKIKLERLKSEISKLQAEAEEEQVGIDELMNEATKREENLQVFNAEFAKITSTSL
ncbi:uncharacterized protein LOC143851522 isoform X3 [Tasmannia lanceolata]|uniref:uncharacterized protein LOC143851522 isoform X3 n=1 Tax=Tasmannia lanceolata TaxID=3420 RepID=UPI0040649FF7